MENAKLAEEPFLELKAGEESVEKLKVESASAQIAAVEWQVEEKVPHVQVESARERVERLVPGFDLKRLVL